MRNPGQRPGIADGKKKISLEGYTPAKMAARAASSLLRAHLVTSARRFVTYRPRDGMFTARGTACLPPEGRQVYRSWDGKFTARGAVSNEPKEKSDGD